MKQSNGLSLSDADDANIPINIFISSPLSSDNDEEYWRLNADNLMPRKSYVENAAYEVYADSKQDLINLIKKYVLPLYKTAVNQIETMIANKDDGKECHFYHWK